jgi:hypothetical protein
MLPVSVCVRRGEKYGNLCIVARGGGIAGVVEKHRIWIATQPQLIACLAELEGRGLICWCAPVATGTMA